MKKLLMFVCVFFVMLLCVNANAEERSWYAVYPSVNTPETKGKVGITGTYPLATITYPSGLKIEKTLERDGDIREIISYPYGSGLQLDYSPKTKFEKITTKNGLPGEIITYEYGHQEKREVIEHKNGITVIRVTSLSDFDIDETILYPYSSPRIERGINEAGKVVDRVDGHYYRLRRITYPNGNSQTITNLGDGLIIRKKEFFPNTKKDGSHVPYLVPKPYPKYARGVADMAYWGYRDIRENKYVTKIKRFWKNLTTNDGYLVILDLNNPPEELPEQQTSISGKILSKEIPKTRKKYYLMTVERVKYLSDTYYSVEEIKELKWDYKVLNMGYPNDKHKDYLASFNINMGIAPDCGRTEYAFFVLDGGNLKKFKKLKGKKTYQIPAKIFEDYNIRKNSLDGTNWHSFKHECGLTVDAP